MDKTVLLKYFKINKRISGLEHTTHLVFDNFAKRDKRLTIIPAQSYSEHALEHFMILYNIFSSDKNQFLEYLIDWGILEDDSLYILRDSRDINVVPDELMNEAQIPVMLLDALIGLYNIHRNNYYYGGVKREDILYKYNRRDRSDCFSFFLSGAKILKAKIKSSTIDFQKEDIKSLVYTLISFLKTRDSSVGMDKIKGHGIIKSIDLFIHDRIIKDIIIEIYKAKENILYYIRLLIKNLFFNDENKRKYYSSIINKLYYPNVHIPRHEFKSGLISRHNIITVSGASGTGKTHFVRYLSALFRKIKFTPFIIDVSEHSHYSYYFVRNITDLISAILKKNDSMIFERFNNVNDEISNEEKMYLLYKFDESIRPVFVLENIENADESIVQLFKSLIEAGIYTIITRNINIQCDQYLKLLKGVTERNICNICLDEWKIHDISAFIEMVLFNENKQKIRLFAELLFNNNMTGPKKVMEVLNYILLRERGLFNKNSDHFKNHIEINIELYQKFKENIIKSLSIKELDILKIISIFPSGIDFLENFLMDGQKALKPVLNSLLTKKLVVLERNKYIIKDMNIKTEISRKISKAELQSYYTKIACFLLNNKNYADSIPPLIVADFLLNGGYLIEAADLLLSHAEKNKALVLNGKLIWYYNKAYDIFVENGQTGNQISILERLFEIHQKRGDFNKAESILLMLSKAGYCPYDLYKKYALLLESTGDNKRAIEYYNKAFISIKDAEDQTGRIDIYIDIARLFIKIYKLDEAQTILDKAGKFENTALTRSRCNIVLSLLGEIYTQKKDYETALKYSFESAELSESQKDYYTLTGTLFNIGYIYFKKRKYETAFAHYKKALDISIKCDNIQGISKGHYNLGHIDLALGDLDKAFLQFTNARLFHNKTNDRKFSVLDTLMIGYLLMEKGEISKAYHAIREGADIADSLKDKELKSMVLYSYGRIYHMLGSYGESINFYFYSKELAKKIYHKDLLSRIYNNMAYLFFDLGDFFKAKQSAIKSRNIEKELGSFEISPLNDAIETVSMIFNEEAGEPLSMIRDLKNENNLPDNYYRFKYYKVLFDAGRFLGLRELMVFCFQMLSELNLDRSSMWCRLIKSLCKQWTFNDLTEEELRTNLKSSEQHDFGELLWIWEYLLANHLYAKGREEESRKHYLKVYERLKDRVSGLSDAYKRSYISSPFRKFAYKKGESIF